MYENLTYDAADGIARIRLERPDVYNAFDRETIVEVNDALDRADGASDADVVVLTGAGDGFCSGADVDSMPDWEEETGAEYGAYLWLVQNVVRRLRGMGPVTIAAVNGPAIGAGCDFALACDLRVVHEERAILREGFVRIGLIPGDGGGWLLPRLIGEAKAKEYLLTGKDIDPDAAVDLGLAVEATDDTVAAATELAEELLGLPRVAVKGTKELIDADRSFEEYCELATRLQWECIRDPEHREAVAAFSGGREPNYDRDY